MFRFYILTAIVLINLNSFANDSITIQSTTSTRDSGLYKYLCLIILNIQMSTSKL